MFASKALVAAGGSVSADAVAVWQQGTTSWILVPVAGRVAAGTPSANGPVSAGTVLALKLADANGALSLDPVWASHDAAGASTPLVVNGVVFVLASGVPATPSGGTTGAVLHVYDGATGKRLWTSGEAMTTAASPGSLWTGLGQIYVGAVDGTVYAFGFTDERR
jgi:hypothetical protein